MDINGITKATPTNPGEVKKRRKPFKVPPPIYIAPYRKPALKRTQSDVCLAGRLELAKSVVPGQHIKNFSLRKDLPATITNLKLEPPPPTLEEARKVRAENKAIRRKAISFLRARTKIREEKLAAAEKKKAEEKGVEKCKDTEGKKVEDGNKGVEDKIMKGSKDDIVKELLATDKKDAEAKEVVDGKEDIVKEPLLVEKQDVESKEAEDSKEDMEKEPRATEKKDGKKDAGRGFPCSIS